MQCYLIHFVSVTPILRLFSDRVWSLLEANKTDEEMVKIQVIELMYYQCPINPIRPHSLILYYFDLVSPKRTELGPRT